MREIYYSPEVVKDLVDLEKKIQEEKDKPEVDKSKISEMRWKQFYRGLEMNTGYYRVNNKQPY